MTYGYPGQDPQWDGFGPQDDQPYLSQPSDPAMADNFLAGLEAEHDQGVRQAVETNLAVGSVLAAVAGLFGRRSRRNAPAAEPEVDYRRYPSKDHPIV